MQRQILAWKVSKQCTFDHSSIAGNVRRCSSIAGCAFFVAQTVRSHRRTALFMSLCDHTVQTFTGRRIRSSCRACTGRRVAAQGGLCPLLQCSQIHASSLINVYQMAQLEAHQETPLICSTICSKFVIATCHHPLSSMLAGNVRGPIWVATSPIDIGSERSRFERRCQRSSRHGKDTVTARVPMGGGNLGTFARSVLDLSLVRKHGDRANEQRPGRARAHTVRHTV